MIGFLVSQRGIELTHKKSKAITKMSAPKTEKEARVSLATSITLAVSLPIDRQLRAFIQSTQKEWADSRNKDFQIALEKIQTYLLNTPISVPPVLNHPFLTYLVVHETSIAVCLASTMNPVRKNKQSWARNLPTMNRDVLP